MQNRDELTLRATRAAAKCGLSPMQLALLQNCAHQVYEEIGEDLEPDNRRKGTCKRSTILEVVTDAGRLEETVKRKNGGMVLVAACRNYSLIDDLIGPTFPYDEYEVGVN